MGGWYPGVGMNLEGEGDPLWLSVVWTDRFEADPGVVGGTVSLDAGTRDG